MLAIFGQLPPCVVVMEACGGVHYWGGEIEKLGHEVRLIPPVYVKPFVKHQKNDATDAKAICEVALRPWSCVAADQWRACQPDPAQGDVGD